jgi:hypothetical protein
MLYSDLDADLDARILLSQGLGLHSDSADAVFSALCSPYWASNRSMHFSRSALDAEIKSIENIASRINMGKEESGSTAQSEHASGITSLEEARRSYLHDSFPIIIPASLLVYSNDTTTNGVFEMKANVLKQLKKDIERDKLVINGELVIGAAIGVDGAVDKLVSTCEQLVRENKLPTIPKNILRHFSQMALVKASRTYSGGLAISGIQAVVDLSSFHLVPQPNSTPPLQLSISLTSLPQQPQYWGLVCQIKCMFVYLVRSHVNSEDHHTDSSIKRSEDKEIKLQYTDSVSFKIRLLNNEVANIDNIINDSTLTGSVTVELVN